MTLAGDKLLILKETGELILAPATPQACGPAHRRAWSRGFGASSTSGQSPEATVALDVGQGAVNLVATLIADVLYTVLNPRIRLQQAD